jgi:hypothetical protein
MTSLINAISAGSKAGGLLRGEVSFERWYFHYHNKVSAKHVEKNPAAMLLPRIWAIASAIESLAKTIFLSLSFLYYLCVNHISEAEKCLDIAYEQDISLYYSLFTLYSPEKAVKDFDVYRGDLAKTLTRTRLFGISLGKHSWGTPYTGTTTVKMVINTH